MPQSLENLENNLLERITRLLEILSYDGLETTEPRWMRSLLTEPSPERQSLMIWVVSQFSPEDASEIMSSISQMHNEKLLQSFSSLGICGPGETGLIEGKAPILTQLRFWRACLDKAHQLHQFSKPGKGSKKISARTDMLIDHLAHSSYLNEILKDTGANVIPSDLQKRYKASYKSLKSIPLTELQQDVEDEATELRKKYSAIDKKWKACPSVETDSNIQQKLCETISSLNKQQDIFQGVCSSYITPWTASTPTPELSNTGEVVHEASEKLLNLTKDLKLMDEVSQKCSHLTDEEKLMTKHINQPSIITSQLHSIVTLMTNAKPGGNIPA